MMQQKQWENSPYVTAFSVRTPDMRGFMCVREIVKI